MRTRIRLLVVVWSLARLGMTGEDALVDEAAGTTAAPPEIPGVFKVMREREEVFEFAEKPGIQMVRSQWVEGENAWLITFASKAACDATVAIVDRDGTVVRHLASGVLGANAPEPFQKDTLSQKIEWDGLTDTFKKAPAGCVLRVSLGLKAEFEKSLAWNPHALHKEALTATGKQGEKYVLDTMGERCHGYVYGADGRYLRTFFPPPADNVEKVMGAVGYQFATTRWGDRVMIWRERSGGFLSAKKALGVLKNLPDVSEPGAGPRPPKPDSVPYEYAGEFGMPLQDDLFAKYPRISVDLKREELYVVGAKRVIHRMDGKTGKLDPAWFPDKKLDLVSEVYFGPDELVYARVSALGYGRFLIRVTRDGVLVPFKEENMAPIPTSGYGGTCVPSVFAGTGLKGLYMTVIGSNNVHQRGLYVTTTGRIVVGNKGPDVPWLRERSLHSQFPPELFVQGAHHPRELGLPGRPNMEGTYIAVWEDDGDMMHLNVVGDTSNGHGIGMDRDGNIYTVIPLFRPVGPGSVPEGLVEYPPGLRLDRCYDFTGAMVKIRAASAEYPIVDRSAILKEHPAVAWAYYGVSGQRGPHTCTCPHTRWDLDRFARSWLPANHLYSVIVLDSNGNRVARIGRYGNVDDKGVRFAWIRTIAASDRALYVADCGNRRILKAALGYHAEATLPVPAEPPVAKADLYKTALDHISRNDPDGLKSLIAQAPGVVSLVDGEKMPLLNRACMTAASGCVRLLIEKGADVKAVDSYGRTALHCAAGWSTLEVVQLLVDKGADAGAVTKSNLDVMEFAQRNYQEDKTVEQRKILAYLGALNVPAAPGP